jgi:hypothetical protein
LVKGQAVAGLIFSLDFACKKGRIPLSKQNTALVNPMIARPDLAIG